MRDIKRARCWRCRSTLVPLFILDEGTGELVCESCRIARGGKPWL